LFFGEKISDFENLILRHLEAEFKHFKVLKTTHQGVISTFKKKLFS
jgi:hypothetical protein